MKKISIVIMVILIIFSLSFVFSQQKDDLQTIKDALIFSTIQAQELQKQNNNLNQTIQRILDDLKKIKSVAQLDSLKNIYGIEDIKKKKEK